MPAGAWSQAETPVRSDKLGWVGQPYWYENCVDGSSLLVPSRYRLCLSAWEGDGMTELPRSLPEFEARFPDEAACARWLLEKRWPDGVRCPACGHDRAWELGRERADAPVRGLRAPGLGHRRHRIARQPPELAHLVPGRLAGGDAQERHLRPAAVVPARARQLQVGLAAGAQAAPGDGRPGPGAARGPGRGGRDQPALSRRGRAGPARAVARRQAARR